MASDPASDKPPEATPSDLDQARTEIERLRRENEELRHRLEPTVAETAARYQTQEGKLPFEPQPLPTASNPSPVQEKIGLFRSLFRGREDVYATRWTNERTGKTGYSPACEDPWSLRKGQPRKYLPLTDRVVHDHLSGNKTIGIFPLLKDDACWFLACDFDKEGWQLDAVAYLEICRRYQVPAYLERSRSGNGGHVCVQESLELSIPGFQDSLRGAQGINSTGALPADCARGACTICAGDKSRG